MCACFEGGGGALGFRVYGSRSSGYGFLLGGFLLSDTVWVPMKAYIRETRKAP